MFCSELAEVSMIDWSKCMDFPVAEFDFNYTLL